MIVLGLCLGEGMSRISICCSVCVLQAFQVAFGWSNFLLMYNPKNTPLQYFAFAPLSKLAKSGKLAMIMSD